LENTTSRLESRRERLRIQEKMKRLKEMHTSEYQQNDADLVANKFDRLSERVD